MLSQLPPPLGVIGRSRAVCPGFASSTFPRRLGYRYENSSYRYMVIRHSKVLQPKTYKLVSNSTLARFNFFAGHTYHRTGAVFPRARFFSLSSGIR